MFSTWKVVASSGGEAITMSPPPLGRRGRGDNDVALVLEDAVQPVDGVLGLGGRFDREDVVVLVLEVTSLVRPQSSQRGRHRRRLQADGRHVDEVHCVAHVALLSVLRSAGLFGTGSKLSLGCPVP